MSKMKKGYAAIAVVAVLGLSAAAYAFWTGGATGSGSATVANGAAGVTISQFGSISGLTPGGPAKTIGYQVLNSGTDPVNLTGVAVSIGTVTGPNITAANPCTATDFQIVGSPKAYTPAITLSAGNGSYTEQNGPTISMINAQSNQDGCKGATVNLTFTGATS